MALSRRERQSKRDRARNKQRMRRSSRQGNTPSFQAVSPVSKRRSELENRRLREQNAPYDKQGYEARRRRQAERDIEKSKATKASARRKDAYKQKAIINSRKKIQSNIGAVNAPKLEAEYVIYDFETTGTDVKNNKITQATFTHMKDGKVVKEHNVYLPVEEGDLSKHGNKKFGPSGASKTTGQTYEGLKKLAGGKSRAEQLYEVYELVEGFNEKDIQFVGHNTTQFDAPLLENEIDRAGHKPLRIDPNRTFDTGDLAYAAIHGIERGENEPLEDFYKRLPRDKFSRRQGWKLSDTAKALGLSVTHELKKYNDSLEPGVPKADLHDARFDNHLAGLVAEETDKRNATHPKRPKPAPPPTKAEIRAKAIDKWATKKPKLGGGFVGGLAAGVVGGAIAYTTYGRSSAEETMERVGGEKNNPYIDPFLIAGGLYGLHKFDKHSEDLFNIRTNIGDFGSKEFFDKASAPRTAAGKYTKYGSLALLAYSGVSTVHNLADNDRGDGWRYPVLSAGIGAAGLIMYKNLDRFGGNTDELGYEISERFKQTMNGLRGKEGKGYGFLRKARVMYDDISKGRIIRDPATNSSFRGKVAKKGFGNVVNQVSKHTLTGRLGPGLLAAGAIFGIGNLLNPSPTGNVSAAPTGNSQPLSYNGGEMYGYRSLKRYVNNYKPQQSNNSNPHGLALV